MQVHIPGFDLALTAASGQSFRFDRINEGAYRLIARGRLLVIESLGEDVFDFSCTEEEFAQIWHNYFDLDRDYGALSALVGDQDSYLGQAYQYASGVRILRQEPFETLIAFIISQRKSIPAIKTCMAALSSRFGEDIGMDHQAFPSPEALASADDEALAACGLGYRTPYVKGTARMLDGGQMDLEYMRTLNDSQLEAALMEFPGVGKKVAACVMLFAYQRMDAFPVDVWIQKVFEQEYRDGFPFERFPGVAGIFQQYLFCFARHQAGRG